MSTVRSKLLLSAAALAALAAAAPARAAVPDPELVIEGPIDGVDATAKTITIMGIPIVVTSGTFDTPTKTGIPLAEMLTPLPGRPDGFVGGTAIATGGSTDGKVTASKLFSDANENVVVGEVTSAPGTPLTVNFLPMSPLPAGSAIPATKPMSIFGFEIDPLTIQKGSLISMEGYLSKDGGPKTFHYHALEADTGTPKLAGVTEVSVARAQCRDRPDANKDDLEVRGWVHRAGMPNLAAPLPAVTITYTGVLNASTKATGSVSVTAPLVIDPATPQYAQYRYSSSNRNLAGCPLKVSVSWQGDTDSQAALIDTNAAP